MILQSPLINVWSRSDTLYSSVPTQWSSPSAALDFFSALRVDGKPYLLMGAASHEAWAPGGVLPTAVQSSVTVWSTQTVYTFIAGAVAVNLTFTSPLLTHDLELLSRPAHYVTLGVRAIDGGVHSVQWYFDLTGNTVVRDPSALIDWSRVSVAGGAATGLRIGSVGQPLLADTNDRPSWGFAYLVAANTVNGGADGGAATVLEYSNVTRAGFFSGAPFPAHDNTAHPAPLLPISGYSPPTGPQVNVDRPGNDLPGSPFSVPGGASPDACYAKCNTTAGCQSWAFAAPGCMGTGAPNQCWLKSAPSAGQSKQCRISGNQGAPIYSGAALVGAASFTMDGVSSAGATRRLTLAFDEVLTLDFFGEKCPPYWRRTLPLGDATVIPTDMLTTAFLSSDEVVALCDATDATLAADLLAAGGAAYATMTQLTYRQTLGGHALVWVPSRGAAWYMLKEISSCGCLNTADVIYPAFPQLLYFSPELMRTSLVPMMEYAANKTSQIYPRAWAPHHLGYWPIADLPYTSQEDMPLECVESRQGAETTREAPPHPHTHTNASSFLPLPSTHPPPHSLPSHPRETSYFILAIAAIAQRQGGDVDWIVPYLPVLNEWYGFLTALLPFPQKQLSTDDFDGPLFNASNLAIKGVVSVAAWGYILDRLGDTAGATTAYTLAASYATTMMEYAWVGGHFQLGYKGSQGDGDGGWAMVYNALWLRVLGFTDLLPNQSATLAAQRDWYAANQMHKYGLPLNSRKTDTKDDWMTFMAATFYDDASPPAPSPFSSTLFSCVLDWANTTTTSREAVSDWTQTDTADAVGFTARPVFGAMYAPMLVHNAQALGLGVGPEVARANAVMKAVHARAGGVPGVAVGVIAEE